MLSPDPGQNYFELFGLPPVFGIDLEQLHESQRDLQSTYHPDRFAAASDVEKRVSVQMAAYINQAYETLRDPVRRSRYLLELSGETLPDDSQTTADAAFLMEQLELREELDACRGSEDALQHCEQIEARLARRATELARAFVDEYEVGAFDAALDNSRKMQFIQRVQQQLAELKFELDDF